MGFCDLRVLVRKTCQSVWPHDASPNASLYASPTCHYLRLFASPFGQGFTEKCIPRGKILPLYGFSRSDSGPVSNEYFSGNFSKLKKRIIIAKGRICTRFLTFFWFFILFSLTCLSWSWMSNQYKHAHLFVPGVIQLVYIWTGAKL